MKLFFKIYLFVMLLAPCTAFSQSTYTSQNIDVIANLKISSDPRFTSYTKCEGWYQASTGKEYAIYDVNYEDDLTVYFMDITGGQVVKADSLNYDSYFSPTRYAIYRNYFYISDFWGDTEMYDLTSLPDSITYVGTLHTPWKLSGLIIQDKLYQLGDLVVYDLENSLKLENPDVLKNDIPYLGACRSVQAKHDTIYASFGYQGFYILKYANHTFTVIDSILHNFPSIVANYAACVSEDNTTLCTFYEPYSLDANIYKKQSNGKYLLSGQHSLVESNYEAKPEFIGNDRVIVSDVSSGIHIFDVSDVNAIQQTGYFNAGEGLLSSPNYTSGIANYYASLPSGRILALDTRKGLFILDAKKALTNIAEPEAPEPLDYQLKVFPVPSNEGFSVELKRDYPSTLSLVDISGKTLLTSEYNSDIRDFVFTREMPEGVYILKVEGEEGYVTQKITVKH